MPSFDFLCAANGQTIEVVLKMHESISTWGELCARKGMPMGDTPAESPIEKVFTKSWVVEKNQLGSGPPPPVSMAYTGKSASYNQRSK